MSDYPDPDEEYELMYADELELLRDEEDQITDANAVRRKPLPAKRSLDFSSPATKKHSTPRAEVLREANDIISPDFNPIPLTPNLEPVETVNNSNKRTVDDLFGDIGDIDFNEVNLPSKRQKTEEEVDQELIDKILENRRLKQLLAEPSNRSKFSVKPIYEAKENLSLDIPKWAFLPLTNTEGDRIYVKLDSEDNWDLQIDGSMQSLQSSYASTWEEARKILQTKQESHLSQSQPLPDMDTDINGNTLWVEKYKPSSYIDLLSEEPVNRALLHWLHLWDKTVFKKEVKTKEPHQRNAFVKRTGQFQMVSKWRGKTDSEPELDEDGRPHHKVALLCGPPGVGKTTLAHLLARLAGYRVVELNASDERSTDAFRTALQNATLMRSVLDAEKRPNCLVLDEIDGAPLPTVELLVRWCTATAESGKKKGKMQPLKRPVVAICNDLYATSLRPLRPISLIIHVGGVSIPRLTSRLCAVAQCERMQLACHVANALATRAQGDVRTAIQVLTYLKAKEKEQLTMADVQNAAVGTKDCNKSIMQALSAIFTINDKEPNAMKIIQAAGEYDRLIDGIFENYLTAKADSRLLISCETLSWLRLYDLLHSWTMRTHNYSLYGALPLCIMMCHTVLASRNHVKLKFPMQAQEMSRKKTELENIESALYRGCVAGACASRRALRLDVLPVLPYILAPKLRSANVQLCTDAERSTLRTVAGALCDYGLQYVQQRTPDGLFTFVLEPDVYRLAFFGNEERGRPAPAIRQAIAREQQLETIRRYEENAARVSSRPEKDGTKRKSTENKENKDIVKETRIPNHLQRLEPIAVEKVKPQLHKDFFGRIVPITSSQRNDAVSDVISSSAVFYQYQEGFNNAVRRNVRVKDLL